MQDDYIIYQYITLYNDVININFDKSILIFLKNKKCDICSRKIYLSEQYFQS